MTDFSNKNVRVTLRGGEWFALMARMANKPLSDEGEKILKHAMIRLAEQVAKSAEIKP